MPKKSIKQFLNARTLTPAHLLVVALLVGVVAFVGGTRSTEILAQLDGKNSPSALDFSSLNDVYSVLRSKYNGDIDPQALIDGAKHGMVAATGDPYTAYFTPAEADEFNGELEGTFSGIGAELGVRDDQLVIVSPLDDSPAKKAGLLGGDAVLKVNGEETTGWTTDKAVSKIRGEKGTTVKLTVYRDNGLKDISITRDTISVPSVKSEITEGNIGVLRISRFAEDTSGLARKAAESFQAAGVKGVVLDLRGNGGGYIDSAQAVASLWLENKVVVRERGTFGTETLNSENNAPLKGIKTIVLVDGGSASASEIVAGALSDHGVATLVGEKTFGKGSAQIIEDVPGGGQLKVTVAKWYTPNNKNINKEGIKPSVEVKITAEDVEAKRDTQKDKALELLR